MTRSRRLATALLVCMLGLPACSSGSSKTRACTQIGCTSGATLDLSAFAAAHTGPAVTEATVCINADCETQHGTAASPVAFASVTTGIAREAVVRVRITLKGENGRVLASDSIRTRLRKAQPNGPHCEPVCFTALVHLTGEGKLAAGAA